MFRPRGDQTFHSILSKVICMPEITDLQQRNSSYTVYSSCIIDFNGPGELLRFIAVCCFP